MADGAATGGADNVSLFLQMFLPLILFFGVMWFFLIRPQRKKEKETRDMRSNVAEGDEIVTIGGIIGRVLSVKEDSVVIYCGSDKTKMEFKKWAIGEVTKKNDKPVKLEKTGKASESAEGKNSETSGNKGVDRKNIKKLVRKEETEEEEETVSAEQTENENAENAESENKED